MTGVSGILGLNGKKNEQLKCIFAENIYQIFCFSSEFIFKYVSIFFFFFVLAVYKICWHNARVVVRVFCGSLGVAMCLQWLSKRLQSW